jgi:hypothetical protein
MARRRYDANLDRDAIGADQPRQATRKEVAYQLNRIVLTIDALHAEVSELRHQLGVAERLDVQRRKVE